MNRKNINKMMKSYVNLMAGDPAPWFYQRTRVNPRFAFNTAAGRYILLCFFGSAQQKNSQAALAAVRARPDIFNDQFMSFYGVSTDPADEVEGRVADSYPGYRFFWDDDLSVSRLYGAAEKPTDGKKVAPSLRKLWVLLDPTLRIIRVVPFQKDGSDIKTIMKHIDALPAPGLFTGLELHAPIIVLPNVFEPKFCQQLISLYEKHGGEESGFMQEVDGKTVLVHGNQHKRRKDYSIQSQDIVQLTKTLISRRITPEIQKVFQFHVTRMERYIVACYAAEDKAHFQAHRDNTTKGTAHRRFAVSINLNDDFDGGEVSFPEYGPKRFKPPVGGAVVFSCSLLHAVSVVTRGRRYAFLPFLYDDAAAQIRAENNSYLGDGVGNYRA